ncbi:VAN3-binding protein-like [Asparagus officinalis]|uniref:VAN3-binding protein-like n=1 Tax=Asparagus officinalis TaxID=4686 RepID=UPI00098E412F|nr:VAN3-binding protein-like [Asparagus officinalis]
MESNKSAILESLSPRPPPSLPSIDPMEFLSRSWIPSAPTSAPSHLVGPIAENAMGELKDGDDDEEVSVTGNPFTFGNSATSQLVMERIMSQSVRNFALSFLFPFHFLWGLLCGGGSLSDSPPVSPSNNDDSCRVNNSRTPNYRATNNKTVGRWLKERREKKKEETRAHNAQLHRCHLVAGVAAAVAAIAAATAALASASCKDERGSQDDVAVASAATLVAAHVSRQPRPLGAEREHLATVVGSAVSVRNPGDVVTLTAAAATALRGAATLKARVLKEVWNIAAVIPVEKGSMEERSQHRHRRNHQQRNQERKDDGPNGDTFAEDNFLGLCTQELLARGTELLKRTRKGDLHWKIVSVYIHRTGVVMLKMKSRHVAGTITKKKKCVVSDICKDVMAWPGRHLLEGGEDRRYFGLKTAEQRVIEFECRSQREYEMWTQGVCRLLLIVRESRRGRR